LKSEHNVEIHIPSDTDTTTVHIEGSKEGVESAKAELLDLVDKMVSCSSSNCSSSCSCSSSSSSSSSSCSCRVVVVVVVGSCSSSSSSSSSNSTLLL